MLTLMTKPTESNQLSTESSPYLLQHAKNPVNWRAWNDQALLEAKTSGKPILLSIGYSACHWCHVMARECFENQEIAALLNQHCINIKVDREERPDIDAIYQSALALMGVQGGWPLTMFCTPDTKPFWGGTYFPPKARSGHPGFADLISKISELLLTNPEDVHNHAQAILDSLGKLSSPTAGSGLNDSDMETIADDLTGQFDPKDGGFYGPPKFPMVPALSLAWRLTSRNSHLERLVLLTADKMAMGGIYDHLGGGFARYAVDRTWLIPHFEKMLYDNAQLIEFYVLIWKHTQNALHRTRIEETIAWAVRELRHEGGGFFAALDADSDGGEGNFYLWSLEEILESLGVTATLFAKEYDVTPTGNWESRSILNRLRRGKPADLNTERTLVTAKTKLLAARATRPRPKRDEKILVDWNGLMIAALTRAAAAFGRDDWLNHAEQAYAAAAASGPTNLKLGHLVQTQPSAQDGFLEDYAAMIRAATILYETTGKPTYLAQAEVWIVYVDDYFSAPHAKDSNAKSYYQSSSITKDTITKPISAYDQPTPSGTSMMAENFARLYFFTGKNKYQESALSLIETFAETARRSPPSHATLISAADFLEHAVQVVIVCDAEEVLAVQRRDELLKIALASPNTDCIIIPPSNSLSPSNPAYGKRPPIGGAAAYICRGKICSLPIDNPTKLASVLKKNIAD